jgi:hypothetical protein
MEREDEGPAGARLRTHPHPIHFAGATGWALFVAFVVTAVDPAQRPRGDDRVVVRRLGPLSWRSPGFVGPVARWLRTLGGVRRTGGALHVRRVRQSTVAVDLARSRAMEVERLRRRPVVRLRVGCASSTTAGRRISFRPLGEAALRAAAARRERRGRSRRGDRRDG